MTLDFSTAAIIEASILSAALALDASATAFAYGCIGVRIPKRSALAINLVCTGTLALAFFSGNYVATKIPDKVGIFICFAVLFIIGVIKLIQGIREASKPQEIKSEVKVLKPARAAIMAIGVSVDGIAVGFGAALGDGNIVVMVIVSLIAHMAAVLIGCELGSRFSRRTNLNLSWFGGALIIVLAFLKLL